MKLLRRVNLVDFKGSRVIRGLSEAALLGLLSGLSCVGVRFLLRFLQWLLTGHSGFLSDAAADMPIWRRAITPALGGLAALAVMSVARRLHANSHFKEYVEAVRFEDGRIPFAPTFWRTISSAFSIATGAAIGREGSMIQFAAAMTSYAGRRLRDMHISRARQVACGVAAAVAAAYQAPIAGIFFALEIVMGRLAWEEVPFLSVASVAGACMSRAILGSGPFFSAHPAAGIDLREAWLALPTAVLMGFAGPLYYWLTRSLRRAETLPLPLFWSGAVVGILSLFTTNVWGNGDSALRSIMQSSPAVHVVILVLICRLCTTTFCVGTGTIGGVFTPTLFAGSVAGMLMGHLLHASSPLFFAIVGMGCLLSAVTHAPLMATFMTVELTGQWHLLPIVLVGNLLAWQLAARLSPHSLYALASPEPTASFPEAAPAPSIARTRTDPRPPAGGTLAPVSTQTEPAQ